MSYKINASFSALDHSQSEEHQTEDEEEQTADEQRFVL